MEAAVHLRISKAVQVQDQWENKVRKSWHILQSNLQYGLLYLSPIIIERREQVNENVQ